MRRLVPVLYGLTAYAMSTATLLYLIGFTGNLLVPRSVDRGANAPAVQALCTDLLLLALFGIQHSVMARRGFKRWWTRLVPPVVERSSYLVATCAVLWLMFGFWTPVDAPLVWHVERDAGVAFLWVLFALGWLMVLVSSYLIDHFELFGLRQVLAHLNRRPLPEPRFGTPLLYRWVRHPLYAGMLLSFWSAPVMTAGHLLFAIGLSAYILIGIAFEERDLLATFGERYRRYRAEVGMLVPRVPLPKGACRRSRRA